MAIEQGPDNAAVQNTGERLMMRLGAPFGDELVALDKTSNLQPLFILRTAAKTDAVG